MDVRLAWQHFSSPPQNYIGTTLFLSYILAALILTTIICIDLWFAYTRCQTRLTAQSNRRLQICTIFAFLSFVILSRSMILVLVRSFKNWHAFSKSFLRRPRLSLRTWLQPKSYVEELWQNPFMLGEWMIQSTLFNTFARDLLHKATSRTWTVTALTTAWANSCGMAMNGHNERVPKLWMYFALAQILPPSFAYFLFQIALIVQRRPSISRSRVTEVKSKDMTAPIVNNNSMGMIIWLFQILINIYLCGFAAEQKTFTPIIVAVRLLLISAFVAPSITAAIRDILPSTRSLRSVQTIVISFLLLAPRMWVPPQLQGFSLFATNDSAPVVALANDWLVGMIGMAVLDIAEVSAP